MKKLIAFVICSALLFSSGFSVFAQEIDNSELTLISEGLLAQPSVDQVLFTGECISLDLKTVIDHMLTVGAAIELAEINKKSDYAISKGYAEAYTTVNSLMPSSVETKVSMLTRDFARENLENNYQAELNSIEKDAVELYYNTLAAQEYYMVAQEDLGVKQLTFSNVQKKYNLGVAAKIDLMAAENSLTEAESALVGALTGYNSAKMNFNIQMGYPLMQEITLVEELKGCEMPVVNLTQTISSALELRNEIKGADFALELQKVFYEHSKYTSHTASTQYKEDEAAYLMAKHQADQIRPLIQMDVIIKYMGLIQKNMAVTAAESTVALAKESYRIAQLTYNAGMTTFADLQDSEVKYNQSKLARISAITDLALALYDFEYASGVGTVRLAL